MQEKTLELNITHEILNLGVAFFANKYLRGGNIIFWKEYLAFSFPIEYATGFHINLEGPKGGYDVALNCSLPGRNEGKAIFLQYKNPCFKKIQTKSSILFNGNPSCPIPHFQFKINSNGSQHSQLRRLSRDQDISYNGNYVLYALPMLKNKLDFITKLGQLVRYTKFRSIDNVARNQSSPVDLGIGDHSILICANNQKKVEVKSKSFLFEQKDVSGDVIAEIVTAIIKRNLVLLKKSNDDDIMELNLLIRYLFYDYLLFLINYFELSIDIVEKVFSEIKIDYNEFDQYSKSNQATNEGKIGNRESDIQMFRSIVDRLSRQLNINENFHVFPDIPLLKDEFLLTLNKMPYKISFKGIETKNIQNISYLII